MAIRRLCYAPLFLILSGPMLQAANVSLTGNFQQDDQVQLINLSVLSPGTVTLTTFSYAGGTDAAGVAIPEGGLDPTLSLFSSSGALITFSDDGTCSQVGTDSVSGQCYDAYLKTSLASGQYTLALTEFDNEAVGPALANGFDHQGAGNFTGAEFGPVGATGPFYDLYGNQRTGAWEVDLLGVGAASDVPEPATFVLAGLGIAAAGLVRELVRRRVILT